MGVVKTHDIGLEEFKAKAELDNIKYYQHLYLSGTSKKKTKQTKADIVEDKSVENFEYLPIQESILNTETQKYKKFEPAYGNYTQQINSRFELPEEFEGKVEYRRVGTLGVKLGMTTLWNRWGDMIPATIIQLDRVQVVQIK